MIKLFGLKYVRVLRYDRTHKKSLKLYKDRKGNLWSGYNKYIVELFQKNPNF